MPNTDENQNNIGINPTNSIDDIILIPKEAIESPIHLPEHPIVTSLKDFGLDEILCAGVDFVSTGIASALIEGNLRYATLPFVGPVLEKFMFFARHLYDAIRTYNSAPKAMRQPLSFYLKRGLKDGSANLIKDLLVHDPIYTIGVAAGLFLLPETPAVLLSMGSYILGIAAVAGLDVFNNNKKFQRIKKELSHKGFYDETYFESRFFLGARRGDKCQEQIMEELSKEFNLEFRGKAEFHDIYIQNTLPFLNGRSGKLRLRSRERRNNEIGDTRWGNDQKSIHSLQIVYTRSRRRLNGNQNEQFNYFPAEKTKICFTYDKQALTIDDLEGIAGNVPYNVAKKYATPEPHYRPVLFSRSLYSQNNPDKQGGIAICTDEIRIKRPYFLMELKVFSDIKLLQEAMRFVMYNYPVLQTTLGKGDLLSAISN